MVLTMTILCTTSGELTAGVPTGLLDATTGSNVIISEGAVISRVYIYNDGDLTEECSIQLGTDDDPAKYVATGDNISTSDLNTNHLWYKAFIASKGLAADAELKITSSETMSDGVIVVELTCALYA